MADCTLILLGAALDENQAVETVWEVLRMQTVRLVLNPFLRKPPLRLVVMIWEPQLWHEVLAQRPARSLLHSYP